MMNEYEAEKSEYNRKWLEENGFQELTVENRYMALAISELGLFKTLEKMNHALNNPKHEVGFQFTKVNQRFIGECYSDLLLFSMDLTFPKSSNREGIQKGLEELGGIEEMREDETQVTYSIQFGEGPIAHTMNDVVRSINLNQGPAIDAILQKLGLTDYCCSFEISKGS